MEFIDLALIVPAFNEEKTIDAVIDSLSKYGTVVVIDDASTDNTFSIAKNTSAVVLSNDTNIGYEKSIYHGFEYIKTCPDINYAITFDADGQHDPDAIPQMIDLLRTQADIVVCSRNYKQRFAEHIFSFYFRLFYSIDDPLSGLKGYNKKIFNDLPNYRPFNSYGTQILLIAASLPERYVIKQLQVNCADRNDGQSRLGSSLRSNVKLLAALIMSMQFSIGFLFRG